MDHQKAWLRKKRVSQKTIVAADKTEVTLKHTDEKMQTFPKKEDVKPERVVRNLNEKLASVLLDCHPKDDHVSIKQAKPEQEPITGQEKPEAKSVVPIEGRAEEHQQSVSDSDMTSLSELEKERKELQENLTKANKSLEKLAAENDNLSKALLVKEKLTEDLQKQKSQTEAEFKALMTRLDTTEKENVFLKYEFRVIEKELEIRNEELEYNRRAFESSRKQHYESVTKIAELEADCERLRLLTRKRLGAPHRTEARRKKSNPSRDLVVRENSNENISLIEKLHDVQKENKTLKEIAAMKSTELQVSRMMYSRTASRLSGVEAQLKERANFRSMSGDLSIISLENGSDDGISSSGSWANALISELENFRDGKLRNQQEYSNSKPVGKVSDLRLLDDFVEMEKLAIVSTESNGGDFNNKELVPVIDSYSNLHDIANAESFDWIQVVLNAILKQKQISKRSVDELLEDIKIALGYTKYPKNIHITSNDLNNSIGKIIGLIERFNLASSICFDTRENLPEKENGSLALAAPVHYYSVHVFQWKNSELSAVLQKLICCCNDVLKGKADFGNFAGELSNAFDWITSNCVAPENAASARNKIKKHFGWNESKNENKSGEQTSSLCSNSLPNSQNKLEEENLVMKDELKKEHEKSKELIIQLCELEENIEKLKAEVNQLKETKELVEDETENQKSINEDLDTQLSVAKVKLNEISQKVSSLEVELEYKSHCCEELEATCLELQLQVESIGNKEAPKCDADQEEKQPPQNSWEITAASVKLAECQETILSLGKQLKSLATPREAALFDKVFSSQNPTATTAANNNRRLHKRFSLHDRMQVEDGAKLAVIKSPENETSLCIQEASNPPSLLVHAPKEILGSKNQGNNDAFRSLAIVQSKKRGVGFLMKLLMRRKKGSNKKGQSLAKV